MKSINPKFFRPEENVKINARIKYMMDDNGEYQPYELCCFDRPVFKDSDWELADFNLGKKKPSSDAEQLTPSAEREAENRRKSFCRARNKLFDLLYGTPQFDTFVTLTFDPDKIDRYDYDAIVKKIGVWLDNRVRRKGLVYGLVPEYHKDGAVHFHGLMNSSALDLKRSVNPYNGEAMNDDEGRPIYNIADFPLGFTTAIVITGENSRTATAKYCYKYITKSGGKKVGGRYYLSGGDLGRPRYEYIYADFENIDAKTIVIEQASLKLKKVKL